MKEIAKIACRIISIFMGIQFLSRLQFIVPFVVSYESQPADKQFLWAFIGNIAAWFIYLLVAVILWVFAENISKKMIGKNETAEESFKIEAEEIQSVAFPIVGLVVLVNSIPKIVIVVSNLIMLSSESRSMLPENIITDYTSQIIGFSAQMLIGIFLFFGSKVIVRALKKSREFGRQ